MKGYAAASLFLTHVIDDRVCGLSFVLSASECRTAPLASKPLASVSPVLNTFLHSIHGRKPLAPLLVRKKCNAASSPIRRRWERLLSAHHASLCDFGAWCATAYTIVSESALQRRNPNKLRAATPVCVSRSLCLGYGRHRSHVHQNAKFGKNVPYSAVWSNRDADARGRHILTTLTEEDVNDLGQKLRYRTRHLSDHLRSQHHDLKPYVLLGRSGKRG